MLAYEHKVKKSREKSWLAAYVIARKRRCIGTKAGKKGGTDGHNDSIDLKVYNRILIC